MVLIYFFRSPTHGVPHPYGQCQNSWIPTRCNGGCHSFCPIHTKFSALNIHNAQNCWVFFFRNWLWKLPFGMSPQTSIDHGRNLTYWKLFIIVLSYFFQVPHPPWATPGLTSGTPQGIFMPLGTPCIKLHGNIWPLGCSGHRASKWNEYSSSRKTYDENWKTANIFYVLPKRS